MRPRPTAPRRRRGVLRAADLRDAGHTELADEIEEALVGRDVIKNCWTFQLVDDYDAGYWTLFRTAERRARHLLGAAPAHVYEAEMKRSEQQPADGGD